MRETSTEVPQPRPEAAVNGGLQTDGTSAPEERERNGPVRVARPQAKTPRKDKATGEFSFTVTATDSAKPQHKRTQKLTLEVMEPLLVKWSKPSKVEGQRVDGSIKVSNQTGDDFDLTEIVVAVAENGRASAIGYQHFDLKKNTLDFEIPFGETLPHGTYQINVDVVAEVQATGSIYRSGLAGGKIVVKQGP